jgi:hypothetical protein
MQAKVYYQWARPGVRPFDLVTSTGRNRHWFPGGRPWAADYLRYPKDTDTADGEQRAWRGGLVQQQQQQTALKAAGMGGLKATGLVGAW